MENRKVRLIDANVFIKDLTAMKSAYDAIALDGMVKALKEAPTIDPESLRPHGEWIDEGTYVTTAYGTLRVCRCSWCRCEITIDDYDNCCPNCGAIMEVDNV